MSCASCTPAPCTPLNLCPPENYGDAFPSLVGPPGPPGGNWVVVETMAAMKALPAASLYQYELILVLGYYSVGDNGGGLFRYDSASALADNYGTVIAPNSGIGRFRRQYQGRLMSQWFGLVGNGVADDTARIAAMNAIGGDIVFTAGTYLCTALTISLANTRWICGKGVTFTFPVLGASTAAITVSANNFEIQGMPKIVGPAAGVYVAEEYGISREGASTLNRASGLTLEVEMYNFGSSAVYAKFTDNILINPGSYFHDCGYSGLIFLSCNSGRILGVNVSDIGPGTGGNAYGISLTHITTNYNGLPNPGTKLATNPFCQDWDILSCIVQNVPEWVGIDAHGAYGVNVSFCKVYNCKGGIHVANSSGDAVDYAGYDNEVSFNVVDARMSDGTTGTSENLGTGINLAGGAVRYQRRVKAYGNTIYGYGVVDNPGGTPAMSIGETVAAVVSGNIFISWGGVALTADDATDCHIDNNSFQWIVDPADTVAICIRNQVASATRQMVTNNAIETDTGTAAREGFRTAATLRPFMNGNDFVWATVAGFVATVATGFLAGNDTPPVKIVDLGGGGGSTTINLAEFVYGTRDIVVTLTASAPISITNITGVPAATQVTLIVQNGSSTITFTRDNAWLAGGAVWAGGAYDTLRLVKYSTGGAGTWVEISRAANS